MKGFNTIHEKKRMLCVIGMDGQADSSQGKWWGASKVGLTKNNDAL